MKKYTVEINDGGNLNREWDVEARDRGDLVAILHAKYSDVAWIEIIEETDFDEYTDESVNELNFDEVA